jgi:hypothetical protein
VLGGAFEEQESRRCIPSFEVYQAEEVRDLLVSRMRVDESFELAQSIFV